MSGNGSAIASIGEHHALLHGPRVIAADESDKAFVAIVASSKVLFIHRFAFDEEGVILGQDHSWFCLIVAEFEAKVGLLGGMGPVVIRNLALSDDRVVVSSAEA